MLKDASIFFTTELDGRTKRYFTYSSPARADGDRADLQGTAVRPATNFATIIRSPKVRAIRDEELVVEITRVHAESRRRYGADKVWRQPHLVGINVARCIVERLMRREELCGVRRGRHWKTTVPANTRGARSTS